MGIKKLRSTLDSMNLKKGLQNFPSLQSFVDNENKITLCKLIGNEKITDSSQLNSIKARLENRFIVIAIDTSIYAMKYKRIFKKIEYGFLLQILKFVSNGILPVYIFDGVQPIEKKSIIESRVRRRKNAETNLVRDITNTHNIHNVKDLMSKITCDNNDILLFNKKYINSKYSLYINSIKKTLCPTKADMLNLQKFMKLIGIPYLCAVNEADELLSYVIQNKIVNVCMSDDTDLLVRGCENILYMDKLGIHNYKLNDILQELNITYDKFVDVCIISQYENKTSSFSKLCEYFSCPDNNFSTYIQTHNMSNQTNKMDDLLKIKKTYTQYNSFNLNAYSSIEKNFVLKIFNYNQIINWFNTNGIIFTYDIKSNVFNLITNANKKIAHN